LVSKEFDDSELQAVKLTKKEKKKLAKEKKLKLKEEKKKLKEEKKTHKRRNKSHYDQSNCISKIFFCWVTDIVSRMKNTENFQYEDLGKLRK